MSKLLTQYRIDPRLQPNFLLLGRRLAVSINCSMKDAGSSICKIWKEFHYCSRCPRWSVACCRWCRHGDDKNDDDDDHDDKQRTQFLCVSIRLKKKKTSTGQHRPLRFGVLVGSNRAHLPLVADVSSFVRIVVVALGTIVGFGFLPLSSSVWWTSLSFMYKYSMLSVVVVVIIIVACVVDQAHIFVKKTCNFIGIIRTCDSWSHLQLPVDM